MCVGTRTSNGGLSPGTPVLRGCTSSRAARGATPRLHARRGVGHFAAVGDVDNDAADRVGYYLFKMNARVVDDLVVNMVDVGEETGELDTMLYKVADTYDDEVKTMTDSLATLMEPIIIVFLGFAVGFIVISLFLPLVSMIQGLA